jgi:uncharacterized membrane protein
MTSSRSGMIALDRLISSVRTCAIRFFRRHRAFARGHHSAMTIPWITSSGTSILFGRPAWLVLIPVLALAIHLWSRRSLAGLGRWRRRLAVAVRLVVMSLVVASLAEPQIVWKNDRLTTLYLVDLSQSVPREKIEPMLNFVRQSTLEHRGPEDLTGMIVFGKNARVEVPPGPAEIRFLGVESSLDTDNTDLAGALRLAMGSFPEDSARRIVLISDGNQNRGNAFEQALQAKAQNIQIDVLPVDYNYDNDQEVLVEKVSLPSDVKVGETVNLNVVLRATAPAKGRLQVFQIDAKGGRTPAPGNEQPLPIELPRGVSVFSMKQIITEASFYRFSAEFIPDADTVDRRAVNNIAEGFTQARGESRVLLIESKRGENAGLVEALREKKINVDVLLAPTIDGGGDVGGDQLPTDIGQLQPYDAVILGNVPKDSFSAGQIALLERNVHDMGAGLVMLGGDASFGAGGWRNTPVEKALPVDMEIKSLKVAGKGALVMIMHASEIAEGNYWQKVIAQEALKTLSPMDMAGMLHWMGTESWLFTLRNIEGNRDIMLRAIDRMSPGDMPDFDPSLMMAARALQQSDAASRLVIVISDGDPTPPSNRAIQALTQARAQVTTVLTAAHGNDIQGLRTMQDLANKTKGRFYNVTNPRALPRIYQKETRMISRPLIYERGDPWNVNVVSSTEPIQGLPTNYPPINGLVLTSLKESELVECPIQSPQPTGQVNPLLAHWTYGLGRSVAFTSDAGFKWTQGWRNWDQYAAFWSQVIRWCMRPTDDGALTMTLRREDGKIKVAVDALDKRQQFLNFLQIQGALVRPSSVAAAGGPAADTNQLKLVQTAPGRYEATIDDVEARGNYFVSLAYSGPDGSKGVISSGLSVPYSEEYKELRSNPDELESLARITNGEVYSWKTKGDVIDLNATVAAANSFRRDDMTKPASGYSDLWPSLLAAAAFVFLTDVGVRRLAPDLSNVVAFWQRLTGGDAPRSVADDPAAHLGRLKESKSAASAAQPRRSQDDRQPEDFADKLARQAAANASTPSTAAPSPKPDRPAASTVPESAQPDAAESYTGRLLAAKRKVWEEKDKDAT